MNLRTMNLSPLVISIFFSGCNTTSDSASDADYGSSTPLGENKKEGQSETRYVFGWGNLPLELADPRGGTTTGTPVTYAAPQSCP